MRYTYLPTEGAVITYMIPTSCYDQFLALVSVSPDGRELEPVPAHLGDAADSKQTIELLHAKRLALFAAGGSF